MRPPSTTLPPRIDLGKIVLFGDSITQWSFNPEINGFGAIIAHAFARKLDVINQGYSGFNTEWCKHLLPSILHQYQAVPPTKPTPSCGGIQFISIFLGANDAVLPEFNTHQHVPLGAYAANIEDMCRVIHHQAPTARILLLTPPPIEPEGYKASRMAKYASVIIDRTVETVYRYRQAVLEVGRAHPEYITLIDVWPLFLSEGFELPSSGLAAPTCLPWVANPKLLFTDGLHLGTEGNRLIAREILRVIYTKWPEFDPYTMQSKIPWHDQFKAVEVPDALFRYC